MSELDKLRKVLDYVPSKQMAQWRDRAYYEALNRRLQRNVAVRPKVVAPKAAKTDAVRVVGPDEWAAAQEAKRRADDQELEMARLQQREAELQAQVDNLLRQLSGMPGGAERARRLVRLELVGVRKPDAPMEFQEDAEAAAETVAEAAPEAAPAWEVVPEEPRFDAVTEEVPPGAPPPQAPTAPADDAMSRIEDEIRKIEEELLTLAQQERKLKSRRATTDRVKPFTFEGHRLFVRDVAGAGQKPRLFYFFSRGAPRDGVPSPMPSGYKVAKHPKTGLPYLKKSGKRRR